MSLFPKPPPGFQLFKTVSGLAMVGVAVGACLLLDTGPGGLSPIRGAVGIALIAATVFGFVRYWRSI
jgi:hypothetical protein